MRFKEVVVVQPINDLFNAFPVSGANNHTPMSSQDNLASSLSEQAIRVVSRDFVIRFENCWYQLNEEQTTTVSP